MTATWATPVKTWADNNLVAASDLNAEIRDRMDFLKSPPTAQYTLNQASDYTTTSTSFVDVDGTNLVLTITTAGGDVLIGFSGLVGNNGNTQNVLFDVLLDGVRIGGDDGLIGMRTAAAGAASPVSLLFLKTGLSAGSHTFKLQWRTTATTATLYAGAGTANFDLHPQFWVREVS
jgi:hypothetical protein